MWQVQNIANNRHRERLAKEQGVPTRLLVMKRPEGLSEPGDKKRKCMPAAMVRFQAAVHILPHILVLQRLHANVCILLCHTEPCWLCNTAASLFLC